MIWIHFWMVIELKPALTWNQREVGMPWKPNSHIFCFIYNFQRQISEFCMLNYKYFWGSSCVCFIMLSWLSMFSKPFDVKDRMTCHAHWLFVCTVSRISSYHCKMIGHWLYFIPIMLISKVFALLLMLHAAILALSFLPLLIFSPLTCVRRWIVVII